MEHQVVGLDSHLRNLPILPGFLNQQIIDSHNKSMKDFVPTLQGMKTNITNLKQILLDYAKMEILATIQPLSKILQEISLIMPEFVTVCKMTLENVSRMHTILENKGQEAFRCGTIFPKTDVFCLSWLLNIMKLFLSVKHVQTITKMVINMFFPMNML